MRKKKQKNSQREWLKNTHQENKRRPFQLLEVMIAFFILLVCAVPTMRIFTSIYQSQQEIVRKNERDHLARLIHAKLTEKLYKREIPLGEVQVRVPIDLQDRDIEDKLKKLAYTFAGTFTVTNTHTPQSAGYPTEYLGEFVFSLTDLNPSSHKDSQEGVYTYFVFIDAGELDNPQLSKNKPQKRTKPPRELTSEKERELK